MVCFLVGGVGFLGGCTYPAVKVNAYTPQATALRVADDKTYFLRMDRRMFKVHAEELEAVMRPHLASAGYRPSTEAEARFHFSLLATSENDGTLQLYDFYERFSETPPSPRRYQGKDDDISSRQVYRHALTIRVEDRRANTKVWEATVAVRNTKAAPAPLEKLVASTVENLGQPHREEEPLIAWLKRVTGNP
jgi:hypothetical protein